MLSNRLSPATTTAIVVVAVAAWLSFGVLAVVDADGTRVGVLPGLALIPLAILIAILVATALRLSRPAILPLCFCLLVFLPWLPLPVPDLFLIWTGPAVLLVWGSIALCLTGIVISARGGRVPALFRDARRAPRLACALAFLAFVSVRLAALGPPGGDEPHYLIVAQSVVKDGDIKVANNYDRQDYIEYWRGPLRPHFARPASNGDLYSGHAPGLPALIVPAYAVGGYWGTVAWVAMLTAMGSMFVWKASYVVTRDAAAAWFGWAAVALTAPVVFHAALIYPDASGGVMLAGGALALVQARERWHPSSNARTGAAGRTDLRRLAQSFSIGLPVALLPWLHTRLALPAALLGVALFLRLAAAVRRRAVTWPEVIAFSAPIIVGLGGWFGFFRTIYGTFDPSAPQWHDVPLAFGHIPTGLAGLLWDQEFGLLVNAPVHILWIAGFWSLFRKDRRLAAELLMIVVPYVLALSAYPVWYGGASPAARYLAPVALPIGVALATLWPRQGGAGRALSLALLGLSVLVAAVLAFGDDGGLAYNYGTGRARWLDWIAPLVNLPRGLPSFFRAGGPDPRPPALVPHLFEPAIAWSISALAGWMVFRLLAARIPPTAPVRAVVAAGCLLGVVSLGASAAWSLAGGTQTTSTRAQLRLLRSVEPSDRYSGVRLPGFHVLRPPAVRAQLALSTSRLDDSPPGALLYLRDVPPGRYQLRAKRRPSAYGELFVGIGRATVAAWRASVGDGSIDNLTIDLPVAASSVVVMGDEDTKQSVQEVALLPVAQHEPPAVARAARARDAARYGELVVFTIDDRAMLDARGFSVLAGRQPDVVVTTGKPFHAIELIVRNVSVGNRVGISAGQWSVERSLAPDEVWRVRVPVAGLGTAFRLGFRVEGGLPPSDGSLGCRVEFP